jgi:hypothetical protein
METPNEVKVTAKKEYLPEFYVEVQEPFFRGNGEHSVRQLEEICAGYKEYTHQADIAFYACSRKAESLKEENERLRAEKKELLEALTIAKVTLVEFYTNDYVRKHGLNEEGMQKVLNSKPVFLIVKEAIEKHSGAYEKRSI